MPNWTGGRRAGSADPRQPLARPRVSRRSCCAAPRFHRTRRAVEMHEARLPAPLRVCFRSAAGSCRHRRLSPPWRCWPKCRMTFRTSVRTTSHCLSCRPRPAPLTTRRGWPTLSEPYEIGYFRDNEWAETPAQMLDELLVRTVRELGYFKAVLTSPADTNASYRLQTTIVELLQDHTVKPPILRLALRVQAVWCIRSADRRARHQARQPIAGAHPLCRCDRGQ